MFLFQKKIYITKVKKYIIHICINKKKISVFTSNYTMTIIQKEKKQ